MTRVTQALGQIAAIGAFAFVLAGTPDNASALLISNPTISPGISKSFQNDPLNGDLSSSLGYKVELTLKFEFGADAIACGSFDTPVACSSTTGRVTATLKNVSDVTGDNKSNITSFGLSLLGNQEVRKKNGELVTAASPLFEGVTGFKFDDTGCTIDDCNFIDATSPDGDTPSDIKGFLNGEIDLGSDSDGGGVDGRAISATATEQETGVFSWLVAGDFASLCSDGTCTTLAVDGSTWASLIDPQFVECEGDDCVDFNAFWGVHMQSAPGGSDKLGGASLVEPPPPPGIPEPFTVGLIGLGLVGLGAMRRRLHAA